MREPRLPMEGACRCGQVRFRISAAPMLTMACHCTGCQRMSSSAYSLTAVMPAQGFEVTAGEPVVGGLHGPDGSHYFCPHCMSWMFTKATGMDWFVNVRPTMLEDVSWFTPFIETYTSEKLPWATTPAAHSYEKFPSFETYGELVNAYAAQNAG
jgi:hypothetical protein